MQATVLETHGQEEREKNRMIASREYRLKGGFFFCLFVSGFFWYEAKKGLHSVPVLKWRRLEERERLKT